MEPIHTQVKTILDVIAEVERIKEIASYDRDVARRARHLLYVEVLKCLSQSCSEYVGDMTTEALWLEDL